MEETPGFYEEKDILGQSVPRIKGTQHTQEQSQSNSAPPPDEFEDASSGTRFANYLLDIIGVLAFGFIIGLGLTAIGMQRLITDVNDRVLGIFIMLVYYTLFESINGRTLGKYITGTKVIDEKGEAPGFGKALGRTLCRFIPFEPFSFFGGGSGGWHDTITKTRVVKA